MNDWQLLYDLTKNQKPFPAPKETVRYIPHYEFLIAIGNDYTAHITMDKEAYEELLRMVEANLAK